jgi:hypothetical protein
MEFRKKGIICQNFDDFVLLFKIGFQLLLFSRNIKVLKEIRNPIKGGYYNLTQGGGGCFKKCHVTFFVEKYAPFKVFKMSKLFCHDTWGGVAAPLEPIDRGGGGSKIGKKSFTYYLNGPFGFKQSNTLKLKMEMWQQCNG